MHLTTSQPTGSLRWIRPAPGLLAGGSDIIARWLPFHNATSWHSLPPVRLWVVIAPIAHWYGNGCPSRGSAELCCRHCTTVRATFQCTVIPPEVRCTKVPLRCDFVERSLYHGSLAGPFHHAPRFDRAPLWYAVGSPSRGSAELCCSQVRHGLTNFPMHRDFTRGSVHQRSVAL